MVALTSSLPDHYSSETFTTMAAAANQDAPQALAPEPFVLYPTYDQHLLPEILLPHASQASIHGSGAGYSGTAGPVNYGHAVAALASDGATIELRQQQGDATNADGNQSAALQQQLFLRVLPSSDLPITNIET
uniref:6-phosphofructokinase 4, chloroplastic n=2 Tax=Lygus hesperus TaxID=30085 RepID=A0A0A9YI90_LYGHE